MPIIRVPRTITKAETGMRTQILRTFQGSTARQKESRLRYPVPAHRTPPDALGGKHELLVGATYDSTHFWSAMSVSWI